MLTGADVRIGGTSTARNRAGAGRGIRLTFSMAAVRPFTALALPGGRIFSVAGFATAIAFVGCGAGK